MLGVVALAALAVWLWPRGPRAKVASQAAVAGKDSQAYVAPPQPRHAPDRDVPIPGEDREPIHTASPLDTMRSRVPVSFTKPGQPMRFIKQVEMTADPELEAAERLEYKKDRLRFRLSDAAAACYDGEDSKASARFTYTLVVKNQRLRVENVKLTESTLGDAQLEECMISQIEAIDSSADTIPDTRQDGASWISLHDLAVRTRGAADRP